jgi:hypothetical protein
VIQSYLFESENHRPRLTRNIALGTLRHSGSKHINVPATTCSPPSTYNTCIFEAGRHERIEHRNESRLVGSRHCSKPYTYSVTGEAEGLV